MSKSRATIPCGLTIVFHVTCHYESDGVVFTDFALGTKVEVNVLPFNDAGRCVKMEYISARREKCFELHSKLGTG